MNDFKAEKAQILELQGELSINDVQQLKEKMTSLLEGTQVLYIDITNLDDIDLAALQLFCSLFIETARQGKEIHFHGSFKTSIKRRLYTAGLIPAVDADTKTHLAVIKAKLEAVL